MPSTAQSAQQSSLNIETADGSAITITGASKASPCVCSFSSGTITAGDIVEISGVVGMTELNGRAYVVGTVVPATSFQLLGVDSTNYTTYSSAGTAQIKTMTKVGNVKDFDIQQDEATEIDVTNLDSTRKEYLIGLAGSWTMSANYDIDTTDAGQAEFEAAQNDGANRVFTVALNSGYTFAGVGYVKSTSASGAPDGVVSGTVSIRGTNQPTWFA